MQIQPLQPQSKRWMKLHLNQQEYMQNWEFCKVVNNFKYFLTIQTCLKYLTNLPSKGSSETGGGDEFSSWETVDIRFSTDVTSKGFKI